MKRIAWRTGVVVLALLLGSLFVACVTALAQSPAPVIPTGISNEFLGVLGVGLLGLANMAINISNRFGDRASKVAGNLHAETVKLSEALQTKTDQVAIQLQARTERTEAMLSGEIKGIRECLGDIKANTHILAEALVDQTNAGRMHRYTMSVACAQRHDLEMPVEPDLMKKPQLR